MGQYYKYLAIDKDNNVNSATSWDYDNGAKLMEHSWISNKYVNACLTHIYNNPCKVAWIGDYSNDGNVFNNKADNFNDYYSLTWNDDEKECDVIAEDDLINFDCDNCNYYLINHTKHIYLDLAKYVAENKFQYEWDTDGYWCINPLPLLTACGNGFGGGDYHGINMSDVGSWTLDEIEFSDIKPDNYSEETYQFKEN